MGVLVKICGINSVEAAEAALRADADFAGLVFHKNSPRNLTAEAARTLAQRMRGRIRIVALFADAGDDEIAAAVKAVEPDFVQLHGGEPPARVADVRARFGIPVIKAFAVAEASDLARVSDEGADMFLFDAKGVRAGGNGAAFDWQLLRGRSFSRPWLLAGGLSPDNVARAIAVSGAPGVDVSSGVETAPGRKDAEKIAAFVANARNSACTKAPA